MIACFRVVNTNHSLQSTASVCPHFRTGYDSQQERSTFGCCCSHTRSTDEQNLSLRSCWRVPLARQGLFPIRRAFVGRYRSSLLFRLCCPPFPRDETLMGCPLREVFHVGLPWSCRRTDEDTSNSYDFGPTNFAPVVTCLSNDIIITFP